MFNVCARHCFAGVEIARDVSVNLVNGRACVMDEIEEIVGHISLNDKKKRCRSLPTVKPV